MSSSKWVNCTTEDDDERFSERSEARRQLLERLAKRPGSQQLPPIVWAFLQVGDLDRMQYFNDNTRWRLLHTSGANACCPLDKDALLTVRLWKQQTRDSKQNTNGKRDSEIAFGKDSPSRSVRPRTSASTTGSSRTTRSNRKFGPERDESCDTDAAKKCKARDNHSCIISRIGGVDAAHIYPLCAFAWDDPRVQTFWEVLGMFWPEEKVKKWQNAIFKGGEDHLSRDFKAVENMITLTTTLHRFHASGLFALRPVRMSEDKTQLELEFHWLPQPERKSTEKMSIMEEPMSTRGLEGTKDQTFFTKLPQPQFLHSGYRFTVTTDDPIEKPLPDPGLVEMQWHLQRILTMSGAAGWREEDFVKADSSATALALPEEDDQAPLDMDEWLDQVATERTSSRGSSPVSSVEVVDGTYE